MKDMELKDFLLQMGANNKDLPQGDTLLEKHLNELSAKEEILFAGALQLDPPETMADVINLLCQLDHYELLYPAGNDHELGLYIAQYLENAGPLALEYLNAERLGRYFREGELHESWYLNYSLPSMARNEENGWNSRRVYVNGGLVIESMPIARNRYCEVSALKQRVGEYSVKLLLSSDARPEGVWLKLPDYELVNGGRPDEVKVAMDRLQVSHVKECKILKASCVLPDIIDLISDYSGLESPLEELIVDGSNLGYVLAEQGQGMPNFMEHFQAAIKYEDCTTLKLALDISQNLSCYDFLLKSVSAEDYGMKLVKRQGAIRLDTLTAEYFDYTRYGQEAIENTMTETEFGYICRNEKEFVYEYSERPGVSPVLR